MSFRLWFFIFHNASIKNKEGATHCNNIGALLSKAASCADQYFTKFKETANNRIFVCVVMPTDYLSCKVHSLLLIPNGQWLVAPVIKQNIQPLNLAKKKQYCHHCFCKKTTCYRNGWSYAWRRKLCVAYQTQIVWIEKYKEQKNKHFNSLLWANEERSTWGHITVSMWNALLKSGKHLT